MAENDSKFPIPEEGTYHARLVWCVDEGTHDNSFQGELKQKHQVYLGFELVGTHKSAEDPSPFVVIYYGTVSNGKFGLSINSSSKLYEMLSKWKPEIVKTSKKASADGSFRKSIYISDIHKLVKENAAAYVSVSVAGSQANPNRLRASLDFVKPPKIDCAKAVTPTVDYWLWNNVWDDAAKRYNWVISHPAYPADFPEWEKSKVEASYEVRTGTIPSLPKPEVPSVEDIPF